MRVVKTLMRSLPSKRSARGGRSLPLVFAVGLLIETSAAWADLPAVSAPRESTSIMLAQADTAQSASRRDARAMVQLMNQLDSMNLELSKLRGKVEELSNSILNAEKRQKDMYLDLDTRLRRIEQSNGELLTESKKSTDALSALRARIDKLEQAAPSGTGSASPGSSLSEGSGQGAATVISPGADAEVNAAVSGAYEAAMQQYRAGDYQGAITAFQVIVQQYPRHPLAVNAQYWTGDSFYQLRAYRSAIDAQKELIATYPNSPKAADAMLNMGSALLGLGDVAGARQTWERLIATYPGSRAAANAGERLQRLP